MFGVGILILLAIYIAIIKLMVRISPSRTCKSFIIIMSVASPLIYPFLYNIYPSHHQFLNLCEADDRKIIHSIKNINYLHLGDPSMCHEGFKYLSSYKGIECTYKPRENGRPGNVRGRYRYIKGQNWSTASCGDSCLKAGYLDQRNACKLSCMQSVEIGIFTNPYDYKFTNKEIIQNRLYLNKKTIIGTGEILAEFKNYTYYPYGNTWAKILGASSGAAPKLYCENKMWIKNTDIFKPNEL